jgi:hypothetical protein
MTQKQRNTEKLRKDGTGRWFLEGDKFIKWQDNAGSLGYIPGGVSPLVEIIFALLQSTYQAYSLI